jgi:phenylpropionate dioxygenase-like ring-hydroxylating dioxygenase large terminal subunit
MAAPMKARLIVQSSMPPAPSGNVAIMDLDYLARFRERSAMETERIAPPAGFPALPDLPLGRYTDPRFYALEQDRLFARSWLYACHQSELPDKGSYRLCDILGRSVLLVRGEDGEVRAFLNACRHRGAPVVREQSGTARMLVCQYHSWGYDLQGNLQRVPDERDFVGLCTADRALPPVRCERWGGWWFVNLDHDAMPLLDWLDPLPRLLVDVAASPMRVIAERHADVRCNWKILAEGFLEVYHARTVHPKTVAPTLDTRGTVISLFDHGHQNMISPVRPGTRTDNRESLATLQHVRRCSANSCSRRTGSFPTSSLRWMPEDSRSSCSGPRRYRPRASTSSGSPRIGVTVRCPVPRRGRRASTDSTC